MVPVNVSNNIDKEAQIWKGLKKKGFVFYLSVDLSAAYLRFINKKEFPLFCSEFF